MAPLDLIGGRSRVGVVVREGKGCPSEVVERYSNCSFLLYPGNLR